MLLENKIEIKVDRIEFIGLENLNNNQIKVNMQDKVENIEILQDKVFIKISRTLECIPKSLFNIYTSFMVTRFLDNKSDINLDKLKEDILQNPNKYIGPAYSLSSNVISNLIAITGNIPIITPPNFTLDQKKDD